MLLSLLFFKISNYFPEIRLNIRFVIEVQYTRYPLRPRLASVVRLIHDEWKTKDFKRFFFSKNKFLSLLLNKPIPRTARRLILCLGNPGHTKTAEQKSINKNELKIFQTCLMYFHLPR